MVGHVTVAITQQIDLKIYPTVKRIFETAMALPEFAKAHPLAQPDTPEAMRRRPESEAGHPAARLPDAPRPARQKSRKQPHTK